MRVAWFSPQKSSSSFLRSSRATHLLLPHLNRNFPHLEIEVFTENLHRTPVTEGGDGGSHHYLFSTERHKKNPFDIFFYQIEDNPSTDFCRMFLGCSPGVTWVHDFLMTYRPPDALATSTWQHHLSLREGNPLPEEKIFAPDTYPFSLREVVSSAAVLFSNEWALGEAVRRCQPYGLSSPLALLSLPIDETPLEVPLSDTPLILLKVSPSVSGRAHRLLPALARQNACSGVRVKWCIASHEVKAAHLLLEEFAVTDLVELVIDVDFNQWRSLVCQAWCTFLLGRTVYGSLHPYLGEAMMAGCPVALSAHSFASYVPDDLVIKIPLSGGEEEVLVSLLSEIIKHGPALRESSMSQAKEYALAMWGSATIARELASALAFFGPSARQSLLEWQDVLSRYTAELTEQFSHRCNEHVSSLVLPGS